MPLSIRARRVGYRVAYRVLQVTWFLRRPHKAGVKCLITHEGRILLVRHTYGPRAWDCPGGGMKRDEPPLAAARREMGEELGLAAAAWRDAGQLRGTDSFRQDIIHCFRADLESPELRVDPVEIATTGWFAPAELPADVGRYVRPFLDVVLPATGGLLPLDRAGRL